MEAPDREEREYELAAAILLLWLLMDSAWDTGSAWAVFRNGFNQHVRPILTRIYGVARYSVAEQFGNPYPVVTAPSGQATVQIPNLNRTIDRYAVDLFKTLWNRWTGQKQAEREQEQQERINPEEVRPVPEFGQSDADRISVTTTTQIHTNGEMDAVSDIEASGEFVITGILRTEPGACKICEPYDGRSDWNIQFPKGTPFHPNCRCHIDWRVTVV